VPEVRPTFLSRQEEEVRGLRVRSHHNATKILLAEQEDKQNSHSLIGSFTSQPKITFSPSRLKKHGRGQVPTLQQKDAMDSTIEDMLLRQ